MSASWGEDDEEFRVGGVKGVMRAKPRFSFTEVKMLLEAVKSNRYIILRKFNQGVSAEAKKQTWAEITDQINGLGENHREVRQIMKKWADLKCDGKRRMAAMRGPNGNNLRKKRLGPVERMVHKILLMSPGGDGDSDLDLGEDDFPKPFSKGPSLNYLSLTDSSHSLQGGASYDISPLSSPEKEFGEHAMDLDETDDSAFSYPACLPPGSSTSLDPLPDDALMRIKPVHTYSRNSSHNQNSIQNDGSSTPPPGPSSSAASTSSEFPPASDPNAASCSAAPVLSQSSSLPAPPPASSTTSGDTASATVPTTTSIPPPPPPAASSSAAVSPTTSAVTSAPPFSFPSSSFPQLSRSSSTLPPNAPSTMSSNPADPLPEGASTHRSQDQVAQMASQSLQQQRASRMLLSSVSQSLEILAQSVQLLVESQQEFVQESLLLQRETVDILRDFSNTALTMLRDKASGGQLVTRHHPSSHF
ncbi:flocculation protein FLO11 [Parambassis ranga]|uniref:Flocculation protein FLO11-like n=1 Tax=Parambassis ranga TaxID=210632 RepID=A0A6P7JEI0_9TELE|nr:flocculation protein FLO11-like [Parambassis ranga]XP_028275136.1 flocculation protein FLO11-like [Parambassis ranga]